MDSKQSRGMFESENAKTNALVFAEKSGEKVAELSELLGLQPYITWDCIYATLFRRKL